jgi:3-oxoacyl-[acyl-carrier-protein] synthase III
MTTAPAAGIRGVRLAGTGICLPPRVVTNHDLSKLVDTTDEWITQRTGIRQRRMVEPGTTAMHLGADALRQALQRAGLQPRELDMVLCATMTPEMCCPSTAARIVDCVGAQPAGAVDLSAACSGFVYGLNMAAALIQSGAYRRVAVIGAEVLSSIMDWKDRRTCILFGDGAGAVILVADDDPARGCLHQSMNSDGSKWAELYCPRRESDLPPGGDDGFSGVFNTLQMNGREVYKFAVSTLQHTIDQTLKAVGLAPGDLAAIVAHQSNQRILESARERLGLAADKLYINIDRFGNTSAASVPLCLHELMEQGRIKSGDLVLFVALGGGLTWASSLWRI